MMTVDRNLPRATSTRWTWAALAYALVFGAGLSYLVCRIPIQVSDSLLLILDSLQSPSALDLAYRSSDRGAFFRPLYMAQIKLLFDWSGGAYFVAYKCLHAGLLLALCWLFVRFLRVRTATDFAAVPLAMSVMVGMHSFLGLVWEAYPVNHYLEVVVACLVVLNLSVSDRRGALADLAAVLTLAAALLTLESGVLVWICLAAAFLAGARGVSRMGVALSTVTISAYFVVRSLILRLDMPQLTERSSGFGFARLEPPDIARTFGDHPFAYFVYNWASSVATVLFSEPRGGEWMFVRAVVQQQVEPWMVINVFSGTLATIFLLWFVLKDDRKADTDVRLRARVLRFVVPLVIAGNAVVSFAYTKDVIVAPAGVCFALGVGFALRTALRKLRDGEFRTLLGLGLCVVILALSSGWAVRAVGTLYDTRRMAFDVRNDWARVDTWLSDQRVALTGQQERQLVERLQRQAVEMKVVNPYFGQRQARKYFDQGQR